MSLISSDMKFNKNITLDSNIDEIYPSFIDVKNPKFINIDGIYAASLVVTAYSKEMKMGFLDRILNSNIDLQLSIFYEKQNSYEIIKALTYCIGNTGAEIKTTNQNQMDINIISKSYEDAKYIRKQLQIGGEELYYIYIYITVYENVLENLEYNLQKIEGIAMGVGLHTRRATYRQEQVFNSVLPIMKNNEELKNIAKKNVLTSDMVCTYPFVSNELCDEDGIVVGVNDFNNSIVMIDRFDTEKYKNANMCIVGTSGSGKSYFSKLMIIRNRYLNIYQYIIDPDREYTKLCEAIDGSIIYFNKTSTINIFDIRESTKEGEEEYLKNKLGKLNIFFEILFPDMTQEEKSLLEETIIECYRLKGITFDDNSLYKNSDNKLINAREFKESKDMPILEDLFNILKSNKKLKRLSIIMKPLINGSLNFLNNHTNIDINSKLVVADIHDIDENNLPLIMYLITEFFWDKIKCDRWRKKTLYLDEAWRMINHSESTANFVFKIFKTIRKYGGAATIITQDINDFFSLDDGKYGKGIINNSNIKCIFGLEENELNILTNVLNLSEEEVYKLQRINRGSCLLYAGNERVLLNVQASKKEHSIITTDRKDLEFLR